MFNELLSEALLLHSQRLNKKKTRLQLHLLFFKEASVSNFKGTLLLVIMCALIKVASAEEKFLSANTDPFIAL